MPEIQFYWQSASDSNLCNWCKPCTLPSIWKAIRPMAVAVGLHTAVIRSTAADTGLMTFWGLLAFWPPSLQCIHTFLFWVQSFLPNVYSFPCASFTVNIITVHIYTYTKLSLCSPNIYQHKKHHISAIHGQQIALSTPKPFFKWFSCIIMQVLLSGLYLVQKERKKQERLYHV